MRYSRFWVGAGIGFATGKSFRTTPVQTSVKKKRNKGRGCTHLTRLPLPRVGIGGGLLIEALSPSSVCSVIRISREKVSKARQRQKQKGTLTPFLVRVGSNALCLNKVSTEDCCNFVPQLYGSLIGRGIRLALVLKSICTHLLAECWKMYPGQQLTGDGI